MSRITNILADKNQTHIHISTVNLVAGDFLYKETIYSIRFRQNEALEGLVTAEHDGFTGMHEENGSKPGSELAALKAL